MRVTWILSCEEASYKILGFICLLYDIARIFNWMLLSIAYLGSETLSNLWRFKVFLLHLIVTLGDIQKLSWPFSPLFSPPTYLILTFVDISHQNSRMIRLWANSNLANWFEWCRGWVLDFFLRAPILAASNFAALWSTDPIFTVLKGPFKKVYQKPKC